MNRDQVIARLKELEPALRERGIESLYLYGSYARNEAGPDSDIDILVEFGAGTDPSLSQYMAPYHLIEDEFPGIEIGYGMRDELVSHYRPYIERSAVQVF